ncbi:MAG: FAD-dependent monooxygenase [Polyangiaceae bacterium]
MSAHSNSNVDVLIVGAGPTGLTLAAMLARANVSSRIVDKTPIASDKSRALVVHAKTLELFQKLDITDELVSAGRKGMGAAVYLKGEKALDAELGDAGLDDTPFSFILFVSQAETERVLAKAVNAAGGSIERGVEAIKLESDANGVTVTLLHSATNSEEKVRARFVVGCDGAHSVVRHAGDFKFEGECYLQDFALADAYLDLPEGPDGGAKLRLCFNDDGLVALFPLHEDNRYRVLATRADSPPGDAGEPTLDEMQALLERFTPFKAKLHDPQWLARFRLHHRQADHYRGGPDRRYFLAGDAAHIHSPAGGQGMNTGIQDAANLAWKLALVVKTGAHDSLLDTYEEERHPVGAQLLKTTDRMFSMNTTRSHAMIALRNFVVRRVAPQIIKTKARGAAFRFLSELDIAYPKSSIVIEKGAGLASTLRAGERAPDAPVDGSTLFEICKTLTHHLLVFAGESGRAAGVFASESDRRHPWLSSHFIDDDNAVAKDRFGIKGSGFVLVRPDGYVAVRAASFDDAILQSYEKRVLG